MNRTFLSRALLLAGLLAAAGAAQGASLLDDEASSLSATPTETWFFPDGSSHTPNLTAQSTEPAAPDTTAMGAGPAPLLEESEHAWAPPSQTWFFPDGSRHTVMSTPADPGDIL